MYAYLDEDLTSVVLQVCWRYVEITDFVLLWELRLRELHLFGNQTELAN